MATRSAAARANAANRGSGKPATNVLAALSAAHWAIHPDYLRTMMGVAARLNPSIDAIEAARGEPLENTYCTEVRDGIAIIPVHGAMYRYADFFSWVSGGATYEQLSQDFLVALEDPAVRGILFDGDTPGGEVHGCHEFAQLIADARDVKPIAWYAAGDTCSAGMWLAAAAGRITASPTAILGSIGTYTCVTDFSKWQQAQGIEQIEIRSSQSPKKNLDPATPEGEDALQQVLDALCGVFIEDLAAYRGVSTDTVLSEFGQGGVFVGAAAVASGLADAIGSFDDALAELRDRADGATSATLVFDGGRAPTSSHENTMARTVPTAGRRGVQPPAAAEDAARASASVAAPDPEAPEQEDELEEEQEEEQQNQPAALRARIGVEQLAASRIEGATAERTRILGIQALGRRGEEDLIAACVNDPACTVEAAALRMRQAEATANRSHLDALAGDEQHAPAPKTLPANASDDANSIEAISDRIANAGKPAGQRPSR